MPDHYGSRAAVLLSRMFGPDKDEDDKDKPSDLDVEGRAVRRRLLGALPQAEEAIQQAAEQGTEMPGFEQTLRREQDAGLKRNLEQAKQPDEYEPPARTEVAQSTTAVPQTSEESALQALNRIREEHQPAEVVPQDPAQQAATEADRLGRTLQERAMAEREYADLPSGGPREAASLLHGAAQRGFGVPVSLVAGMVPEDVRKDTPFDEDRMTELMQSETAAPIAQAIGQFAGEVGLFMGGAKATKVGAGRLAELLPESSRAKVLLAKLAGKGDDVTRLGAGAREVALGVPTDFAIGAADPNAAFSNSMAEMFGADGAADFLERHPLMRGMADAALIAPFAGVLGAAFRTGSREAVEQAAQQVEQTVASNVRQFGRSVNLDYDAVTPEARHQLLQLQERGQRFVAGFVDPVNPDRAVPTGIAHDFGMVADEDLARRLRSSSGDDVDGFVDLETGNFLTRKETAEASGAAAGESSLVQEAAQAGARQADEPIRAGPPEPTSESVTDAVQAGARGPRTAIINPETGETVVGEVSQVHGELMDQLGKSAMDFRPEQLGFADDAGNFLTREQARQAFPDIAPSGRPFGAEDVRVANREAAQAPTQFEGDFGVVSDFEIRDVSPTSQWFRGEVRTPEGGVAEAVGGYNKATKTVTIGHLGNRDEFFPDQNPISMGVGLIRNAIRDISSRFPDAQTVEYIRAGTTGGAKGRTVTLPINRLGDQGFIDREILTALGRPALGAAIGAAAGATTGETEGMLMGAALGAGVGVSQAARRIKSAREISRDMVNDPFFKSIAGNVDERTARIDALRQGPSKVKGWFKQFKTAVVDKGVPMVELDRAATEAGTKTQLEAVYRTLRGAPDYVERVWKRGVLGPNEAKPRTSRSLEQVLGGLDGDQRNALSAYGLASRVLELIETGRPIPKAVVRNILGDTAFGRRLANEFDPTDPRPEVLETVAEVARRTQDELGTDAVRGAFGDIQEHNRAWFDVLVKLGRLTREEADDILAENSAYMPLFREFAEDNVREFAGSKGRQGAATQILRKIRGERGKAKNIIDPLESLVTLQNNFARTSMRQRVVNAMLNAAEAIDGPNPYMRRATPQEVSKAVQFSKEQLQGQVPDEIIEEMPTDVVRAFIGKSNDELPENVVKLRNKKTGKDEWWVLDDSMEVALNGIDMDAMPGYIRTAVAMGSKPAQALRFMVTRNPAFQARNFIRDFAQALVVSKYKRPHLFGLHEAMVDGFGGLAVMMLDRMPSEVGRAAVSAGGGASVGALVSDGDLGDRAKAAGIGAAIGAGASAQVRGLAKEFAARIDMTPEDLITLWHTSGASQSSLTALQPSHYKRGLTELMEKGGMLENITNPLHALQEFGLAVENANRLGEFARILGMEGLSDEAITTAAREARDLSIDFARHGGNVAISALRPMAAFWNARLQGYDKLARSFVGPESKKMRALSTAISTITLPSLILWQLNRKNDEYWERPLWERNLFWLVPQKIVGGEGFIRIPKPFELGFVFGSAFERFVEALDPLNPEREEGIANALGDAGEGLLEDFAGQIIGFPGLVEGGTGLAAPIPTALAPLMENWGNQSWSGVPIVSEFEAAGPLPDHMKGFEDASPFGRAMAKYVGIIPGLKTPEQFDNLFTGYTGTLGQGALDTIDTLVEKLGGTGREDRVGRLRERFILRDFFTQQPGSRPTTLFFDRLERAEGAYATVKKLADAGRTEEAREAYLENFDDMAGITELRQASNELRDLRALAEEVQKSTTMSGERKQHAHETIAEMSLQIAKEAIGWNDVEPNEAPEPTEATQPSGRAAELLERLRARGR